ncbi:MAG TPA: LysM peptidoglycan-binding domain-containing protein, partial [Pyrinomonadaceae bacterium]|nr:LysM peptidoglycan-binding domain-containing protein [Pyrinomonadaceae bacterium]
NFSQMFGTGAAAAKGNEDKFETLKQKYQSVLNTLDHEGARLHNLHVEGDKLVIRATAPSEEAMNKAWDQIKLVDPNYGDLAADIQVEAGAEKPATETYTVKAGDSLWRIAQNKLGDGNRYMEIFYANRDKMDSPQSVIHPGDELNVPTA